MGCSDSVDIMPNRRAELEAPRLVDIWKSLDVKIDTVIAYRRARLIQA